MDRTATAVPASPGVRVGGSFRDPSGFVFERDGTLYRQVQPRYAAEFEQARQSGLFDELIGEGLLVAHEEVDVPPADGGPAYRILAPERVPFVSYPYEWCFSQLRDAALLTLDIQRRALQRGMSLKDASAYNVQFRRGRPVFIDTLSFERLRERPWSAYRQFVEHFLAPLALASRLGPRTGRLLRADTEGIPVDVATELLPRRTWLNPSLLIHVHMHAKAAKAWNGQEGPSPAEVDLRRFPKQRLEALVQSLEEAVQVQRWGPRKSEWSNYASEHGYAEPSSQAKRAVVSRFLDETCPSTVWDLGANTGEYSRLAAVRGAATVAMDSDPACVEELYRRLSAENSAPFELLPLVMNLLDPSPALGWMSRERLSLLERGPADACLLLAAIHHLAVGGNVPLGHLADFCRKVGRRVLVEFVPPSDPQFRRLLRVRDDVFEDYTRDTFEVEFGRRFRIERRDDLPGSERSLYSMTARGY